MKPAIRLCQISDCHLFADPSSVGYGDVNPYESLYRVLVQVAHSAPDGVIVTGDISGDDSEQSYAHFLALMTKHLGDIPWWVIPGNHDNNSFFNEMLSARFLPLVSGVTIGNWMLWGADTRSMAGKGHISRAWLEQQAKQMNHVSGRHHLLVIHHHPIATDSWMDKHCLEGAGDFLDWLKSIDNLPLVIHGHIHHASAKVWHGTSILSAPSTCWQWAMKPEFGVATCAPGYRQLVLNQDGQWRSEVRRCQ